MLLRRPLFTLLVTVNVLCAVPLLLALVARWWPPHACVACGLANVALPWLFVVPTALIIVWALARNRWAVAANVVLLAMHWPHPIALYQMHAQAEPTAASVTVMTANLDEFVYARAPQLPGLAQFVRTHHPDVLCLQEVYYPVWYADSSGKRHHNLALLQAAGGYTHVAFTEIVPGYGLAVLSKHPILAHALLPGASSTNGIQKVWLTLHADTVLLYNLHLQSVRARGSRWLAQGIDGPAALATVADSLANTWRTQHQQALALAADRRHERHAALVVGDLNNPPFGNLYATVRGPLNDSFYERGNGFGSTYGSGITALRLDYIFADARFAVSAHQTIANPLSNHHAVVATFSYVKK
jgi:endonuclease/exonuclease/phosphatase family metal-dependent hydrolase